MKKQFLIIPIAWVLMFISINVSYAYNAGFKEITYNPDKDKVTISLWYPTDAKEQIISY